MKLFNVTDTSCHPVPDVESIYILSQVQNIKVISKNLKTYLDSVKIKIVL